MDHIVLFRVLSNTRLTELGFSTLKMGRYLSFRPQLRKSHTFGIKKLEEAGPLITILKHNIIGIYIYKMNWLLTCNVLFMMHSQFILSDNS